MQETQLLQKYLSTYTDDNRYQFVQLALNKKMFPNLDEEYIKDIDIRQDLQSIINKNVCTEEDFKRIFNLLTEDQIFYIGY